MHPKHCRYFKMARDPKRLGLCGSVEGVLRVWTAVFGEPLRYLKQQSDVL